MKKTNEVITNSHSTLNSSTKIKGELSTDNNMRIDGMVEGNINSKAKLVLGPTAQIKGNIICQNADIECTVIGNVYVENQLTLFAKANIKGEIYTKKLIVESGAQLNGKCEMGNVKDMKDSFSTNPLKTAPETIGQSQEKTA